MPVSEGGFRLQKYCPGGRRSNQNDSDFNVCLKSIIVILFKQGRGSRTIQDAL